MISKMSPNASFIELDGRRHEVRSGELELYHCEGPCADWNLTLQREGPLYLAGTVEPSPREVSDLDGARLQMELRDIDSCFERLLGQMITHYPLIDGVVCAPVFLDAKLGDEGLLLTTSYSFDWDRALDEDGAIHPASRSVRFELRARVVALHAGGLP